MDGIRLESTTKIYPNGVKAIDNITLDIHPGEFMVLVGPSGCGKSTLLRMIAGLEAINGGEILIGRRRANDLPPKERDIAMVFQNYALYPHMTVYKNMAFGLKLRMLKGTIWQLTHWDEARRVRQDIRNRVNTAAGMLNLGGLLERKPKQLSGGQR